MRAILIILLFGASIGASAIDSYRALPNYYIIKSDTYTNDLLTGQVRVKGHVLDYKGEALAGTLVSTMDEETSALTDANGAFDMIVHDSDTSIFAFKEAYTEIAIARYDFRAGHTVEIEFRLPLKIEQEPKTPVVSFKPVIYLYSTTTLNVSLALDYLGELTFTYPEYNEGWNVTVGPNGIQDAKRTYPYLFWEGEMDHLTYERNGSELEGQLVATDTLVEFLEKQLSDIGLNRTEQADFITFWAPKMSVGNYVFVQFLLDDLYTSKIAELTMSPEPESLKRVYLLYTTYQEFPDIDYAPQQFEPFDRKGFTLIEWGGSELKTLITL